MIVIQRINTMSWQGLTVSSVGVKLHEAIGYTRIYEASLMIELGVESSYKTIRV